ncbi:MAG: AAA family ATPase [Tissierellia bacterium]|nr:AAA family ATPase [Tissierellia bacterium]
MAKKKNLYRCSNCEYESPGYLGKCPMCGQWSTFQEVMEEVVGSTKVRRSTTLMPSRLLDVEGQNSSRILSGIEELDRVMGGGIVRDSVTILTARPGAGKSTLLLQLSNALAKQGYKVLYASGEESESQIRKRGERILPSIEDTLYVLGTTSFDQVLNGVDALDIDVLIVDSIQTFVLDEHMPSRAGSPTQTLECTYKCVELAKDPAKPRIVFIVGQMNKDDELKGLRSIEHLVDTVLYIEGEKGEVLRSVLSTKNRYGSTGEMGFFHMEEKGLISINNPSEYFMTMRPDGAVKGSALGVIKEGTRPILLEVESLMNRTFTPYPSRITESVSKDTLNIMISILEDTMGLKLFDRNVVLKAVGGLKATDPSLNFAIVMSIASSYYGLPMNKEVVFLGDVALTGEVRKVPGLESKAAEADRLGFKEIAISSRNNPLKTKHATVKTFDTIEQAIRTYLRP